MTLKEFVATNADLYATASQDILSRDALDGIEKGIISVSLVKKTSQGVTVEGYAFKLNKTDYFFQTSDELKGFMSDNGYTFFESRYPNSIYKNSAVYNEYKNRENAITKKNEVITSARSELNRNTINYLFSNYDVTYIRFGTVPQSGYSHNYRDNRPEKGVSVYAAVKVDDTYYIDVVGSIFTYGGVSNRECYSISGDVLNETGSDGEPLVENASIIRQITEPVELVGDFIGKIFS